MKFQLPKLFRRAVDLSRFTMPPKSFNEGIREQTKFTPDVVRLEQKELHLLFVPDDVKRSEPNYQLIQDYSVFVCNAFTKDFFSFYVYEDGTPVALVERGRPKVWPPKVGPIRGELHAVGTSQIIRLDTHRQNGIHFNRRRLTINVRHHHVKFTKEPYLMELRDSSGFYHGSVKDHYLNAWMYVGNPDHWDHCPFGSLQRVQMMQPNNREYPPYFNYVSRPIK